MENQTSKYWKKRTVQRTVRAEKEAEKRALEIQRIYTRAENQVVQEINTIYRTYAKGAGLDVDKLLQKLSIEETHKFWLDMKQKGHLDYITSNYSSRITRLEQIKGQLFDQISSVAQSENDVHTQAHTATINEAFNRTIFDTSRGINQNIVFGGLNPNIVNGMLNQDWQGSNYSKRIWGNTNQLATYVQEELGSALLTGRSPQRVTRDIQEKFGVSKYVADRLIRTETNYFQNEAEAVANEQMKLDRYIFVATLDRRTSTICASTDGRIFNLKDRVTGVNYPPMHPNCRSTTRVYLGKEYEPKTRLARDENGKNVEVENMTYREWKKNHDVLSDVQPTKPPVPQPQKVVVAEAKTGKDGSIKVKTSKENASALPIQPRIRGDVDPNIVSMVRDGAQDVFKRYPQAFDRLDEILISKTMGRGFNGVYKYGIQMKNKRFIRNEDGSFKLDDLGRRMVQGETDATQKISVRVPSSKNTLEHYASRVKELNDQGYWATNNPKGVIYHELGHSLEQTMNMQRENLFPIWDKFNGNNQTQVLNDIHQEYLTVNRTMSRGLVSRDLVEATLTEAHPTHTRLSATKKYISEYAKKDPAEAFAELFTKHMNGDKDDVTKVFGKNLDNMLKELKLL